MYLHTQIASLKAAANEVLEAEMKIMVCGGCLQEYDCQSLNILPCETRFNIALAKLREACE